MRYDDEHDGPAPARGDRPEARTEVEARRDEALEVFRIAGASSPLGFALFRPGRPLSMVNQRMAEISGYTIEEIESPAFSLVDVHLPQYRAVLRQNIQRRLAGEHVEPYAVEIATPSGEVRWIEIHNTRVFFDGEACIQVQVLDITERRRAQMALERSHAVLDQIYSTAPIGMCLFDRDLRYLRINQLLADINGIPLEDHAGRTMREIIPELADQIEPFLFAVVETGEPVLGMPVRGVTAAEPETAHDWVCDYYPYRDADGSVCGVSVIVKDVTEIKQAMRDRQRFVEMLLTAQEDERRRIGRELHDGVGSMLVSLSLGLRILQSLDSGPHRDRQIENLQQLAHRLISDVSLLGKGLHPGVLDDLGLAAAVEQYAAEYQRAHDIEVDVVARTGTIPTAHATAAYRVVQEALTNVGKHASAKSVSVTLLQSNDELRIVVEDDGCGFQETATGSHDPGLGLRSLRERVALLGGTLTVQSNPGHGTTLAAMLPLPADAADG